MTNLILAVMVMMCDTTHADHQNRHHYRRVRSRLTAWTIIRHARLRRIGVVMTMMMMTMMMRRDVIC
jgi:hypothetical protein